MAYREVVEKIKYPQKTSHRFKRLDGLDRLRDGTLYEHIEHPFDVEPQNFRDYIALRDRRPSVIWRGAKMLVDQISGLLWGDEQMPVVRTYMGNEPSDEDIEAERTSQHIVEQLNLSAVMDEVTRLASSGSCAIIIRATDDEDKAAYIEVVPGKFCTPTFDKRNPLKLLSLEQLYTVEGSELVDMGYEIKEDDLKATFWFRLVVDAVNETRYLPMKAEDYEHLGETDQSGNKIEWKVDDENTWPHGWPRIPVIIGRAPGQGVSKFDGECLYGPISDLLVSLDYDLSQLQRGYRYTADPLLAIKRGELAANSRPAGAQEPSNIKRARDGGGRFSRSGATRILDVEPSGDAKYLEISGQALKAFEELAKTLREWGLEICGGMKSDSETTKGVQSGRALEMLYQALILVVKRWRVALGNKCFLPLMQLLAVGISGGIIKVPGVEQNVPTDTVMRLIWPQWITPSGQDLVALANAAETLAGGSPKVPIPILPRDLITRYVATQMGQTDTSSILKQLDKQTDEDATAETEAADDAHDKAKDLIGEQAKAKAATAKPPAK